MPRMKFMTKAIENAFAKQGDTSNLPINQIKIIGKWFNPTGVGTWYCYEYNKPTNSLECFVELGNPHTAEAGFVSIDELQRFRGRFGLGIERDKLFPIGKFTLSEVQSTIRQGKHL